MDSKDRISPRSFLKALSEAAEVTRPGHRCDQDECRLETPSVGVEIEGYGFEEIEGIRCPWDQLNEGVIQFVGRFITPRRNSSRRSSAAVGGIGLCLVIGSCGSRLGPVTPHHDACDEECGTGNSDVEGQCPERHPMATGGNAPAEERTRRTICRRSVKFRDRPFCAGFRQQSGGPAQDCRGRAADQGRAAGCPDPTCDLRFEPSHRYSSWVLKSSTPSRMGCSCARTCLAWRSRKSYIREMT
ncbi:hypothetical protein [Streptomyces sp. NPDC005953]|uniref:hypothetical protein n=1 Tax=Streptomyces sp. NPDC005953 TaxID=3156719 RepID=UPI0033C0ACD5